MAAAPTTVAPPAPATPTASADHHGRPTTADARRAHEELARYIHRHFRRRLSFEEAGDAAAGAMAELELAKAAGHTIASDVRWTKRAAWRNALDTLRKIEGEGKVPRPRPADIEAVPEIAGGADHDQLVDEWGRASDARDLAGAFTALRPDEQRLITLRYFDELPVEEVMQVLGCNRHRYENLHKRAVRRLREHLVATATAESCGATRSLIVRSGRTTLTAAEIAVRDAHVSSCLSCRAFAGRRSGMIATLPAPALGLVERIAAALAAATTGGGGGAALLSGAGAAKTVAVVCSAGAVAAGVCVTELEHRAQPQRPTKTASNKHPNRIAASRQVAAQPPAAVVATTSSSLRDARPATTQPPSARAQRTAAEADRPSRKQAEPEAEVSPFVPEASPLPESEAQPQAHAASAAQPPATQSTTTSSSSRTSSSTFAQEFTP